MYRLPLPQGSQCDDAGGINGLAGIGVKVELIQAAKSNGLVLKRNLMIGAPVPSSFYKRAGWNDTAPLPEGLVGQ